MAWIKGLCLDFSRQHICANALVVFFLCINPNLI